MSRMVEAGSLAPDSFINPSLPLYGTLPVIALQHRLAAWGMLHGHAADPLLAARLLSAVLGALAVMVVGLLALRTGLGLVPPLFLAVMPGMVNLCHFATPEAWLLLGAAAVVACAVAHVEGRCSAAVLGLVLGLTASTKYTAAALLAPCVVAVWLRPPGPAGAWSSQRSRAWLFAGAAVALVAATLLLSGPGHALAARLHLKDARLLQPEHAAAFVRGLGLAALLAALAVGALAALATRRHPLAARLARSELVVMGLAAAGGFLAGTPFAALQPVAFASDLAFNQQTRHAYKGLVGASTSYVPYLGLLMDALTAPFLVAVILGLLVAAGRALQKDRHAPVMVAALLAPYLLVASSGHQALRFLAPAFPAAAWLAALGLAWLREPRTRRAAQALVAARALVASLLVVRLFFVDARIQASRWLAAHVHAGSPIDVITNHAGYAPTAPSGYALRVVPTLSREMAPAARFVEAASRYPGEGAPWLVLTASYYSRFLEHPDQAPERARFFDDLLHGRAGYEVAARFRQQGALRYPAEFLDPEIVVLRKR